jgi:hypothetical protein
MSAIHVVLRFSGAAVALLSMATGCANWGTGGALSTNPDKLAAQAIEAMGGRDAFAKLRYVRFDFGGRRSHVWDRHTGDYRIETRDDSGLIVILFNTKSRTSLAFRNNRPVPPGEQADWFERAYGWYINDTYWLMSATKTLDPGTHRSYEGEQVIDGKRYPTFKLWFDDDVGLTPRDVYWFHIDPETRRPAAWSFILKGGEGPPRVFKWSEWMKDGELMLPVRFDQVGSDRSLEINNLYTPGQVDGRVFAYGDLMPQVEERP